MNVTLLWERRLVFHRRRPWNKMLQGSIKGSLFHGRHDTFPARQWTDFCRWRQCDLKGERCCRISHGYRHGSSGRRPWTRVTHGYLFWLIPVLSPTVTIIAIVVIPVVGRQRGRIIIPWETFFGICVHHGSRLSLQTGVSWTHGCCLAMVGLSVIFLSLGRCRVLMDCRRSKQKFLLRQSLAWSYNFEISTTTRSIFGPVHLPASDSKA